MDDVRRPRTWDDIARDGIQCQDCGQVAGIICFSGEWTAVCFGCTYEAGSMRELPPDPPPDFVQGGPASPMLIEWANNKIKKDEETGAAEVLEETAKSQGEIKMDKNKTLLLLVASAAVGGITSLLASYFFLAGVGTMIINDRVDEHVEDLDTADRIFLVDGPMTPSDTFHIKPVGRQFSYDVISDTDGFVIGVHVMFKAGNGSYLAEVESLGRVKRTVHLDRGVGAGTIKMGKRSSEPGDIKRHGDY